MEYVTIPNEACGSTTPGVGAIIDMDDPRIVAGYIVKVNFHKLVSEWVSESLAIQHAVFSRVDSLYKDDVIEVKGKLVHITRRQSLTNATVVLAKPCAAPSCDKVDPRIPCSGCFKKTYCSEECRQAHANEAHQGECGVVRRYLDFENALEDFYTKMDRGYYYYRLESVQGGSIRCD
ncbi:uncharacterized protein BDZ99DRAFT_541948 [Mytilinidion resinicola]|uniref:MYND-type domain-containing protein n=1 Tax=Mytilinidion resinicola TaxID=574789 RepID=A0A6A6Z5A8_9PEZI|nr:uncharacterized protein BDZ99DRAFT_541948 [Mytilinidion resinicola]KAF2815919.1 hypothetical protein BDZ99DRAFT_541948 [Mytilinidion resinicola]